MSTETLMDTRMHPEKKAAWIAALRSDFYKQGKHALVNVEDEDNMTYCCLGVLCDLAVNDGVELDVRVGDRFVSFDGFDAYPPVPVLEWAGIGSRELWHVGETSLPGMNDDGDKTFQEIADVIEREF